MAEILLAVAFRRHSGYCYDELRNLAAVKKNAELSNFVLLTSARLAWWSFACEGGGFWMYLCIGVGVGIVGRGK